jgi:hypothetical protein
MASGKIAARAIDPTIALNVRFLQNETINQAS